MNNFLYMSKQTAFAILYTTACLALTTCIVEDVLVPKFKKWESQKKQSV